jgi:vacuolar-type H+-ATPase subunit E/Vma4
MKPLEESLDSLARVILREVQDEARRIQAEASEKAETIRNKAREQADAERREILDRARQDADRIRSQVVASAQLKARTLQLEHREKLLDRVFEAAKKRLPDLQKRPDYKRITGEFLREAIVHLKADQVQVRADAGTLKSLKEGVLDEISRDLKVQVSVQNPLDEGIGVIVDTQDGHLHYDNTLETRLGRLQSVLRSAVHQVLMGEKL